MSGVDVTRERERPQVRVLARCAECHQIFAGASEPGPEGTSLQAALEQLWRHEAQLHARDRTEDDRSR